MSVTKVGSSVAKRKRKLETNDDCKNYFDDFCVVKVLNENAQHKSLFVHGRFGERPEDAVLILEKTPFAEKSLPDLLKFQAEVKLGMCNDVYTTLELYPEPKYNGIKSTLIYPATEKHLLKYSAQKCVIVNETPDDYLNVVLPCIQSSSFSRQWVYNILEKESEVERIVHEDLDPQTGFVLLPDMKWDGKQIEDLYLIAFAQDRSLHSLRNLTGEHISLLENIQEQCLTAITAKYGVPRCSIRAYLHYIPSYYHLHVHFTHMSYDAPGIVIGKAHLLNDVIDNLRLLPDFYQRKTLTYILRENDELFHRFTEAGRV